MSDLIWPVVCAGLVLVVPGALLLVWLRPSSGLQPPAEGQAGEFEVGDGLCWLADAIALSMALAVLAGLWLFVVGVHLPPVMIVGLYAACFLALLLGLVRHARVALARFRSAAGWQMGLPALALVIALLGWRLYQARDLVLPAWVDSVHHTLIVNLILSSGGLPETYLPYANAPFFYHYGFHLIAALFTFLSRMPSDQAILWFGQVINAAVALSVYRTAYVFGDPQRPGARTARAFLAALLVGFAMQMPAYYLTWGRYTLLSGLVMVGPAIAAAYEIWNGDWKDARLRPAWLRLVLLIGGLAVTHYFALLLVALFLVVLGLSALLRWVMEGRVRKAIWLLAGLSMLGVLLASPWLLRIWVFDRNSVAVKMIGSTDQSAAEVKRVNDYFNYVKVLLGPKHSHILMALAGVGWLAGWRRARMRVLLGWALLLVLFTLPWGLKLGPFRPDHFAIILFFPASILLADLLVGGAEALTTLAWLPRSVWVARAVLVAVSALLIGWGMQATQNIINPVTVLVNRADVDALQWVREHTPPDARFYINSVLWQGGAYRGVDGGYWLEPYTGRFSLIPPVVYTWEIDQRVKQIADWSDRSNKLTGCTAEFWDIVREANLNYIYLRQDVGHLQPEMLTSCAGLVPAYQEKGVFIYQIISEP